MVQKKITLSINVSMIKNIILIFLLTYIVIYGVKRQDGNTASMAKNDKPSLYLIDRAAIYVENIQEFEHKVLDIADKLKIAPEWLMAVIYNESRFKSSVYNYKGSGAVGLLQFMPSTAIDLGTTSHELANMNATQQLDFVHAYFKKVLQRDNVLLKQKGGFANITETYLAVLYPRAIGKDYCYSLYAYPSKHYSQNRGLDTNGDKSVTVSDIDSYLKDKYPIAYITKYE